MFCDRLDNSVNRSIQWLFYALSVFALLGPTFGVVLVPGFKLTFFRVALFLFAFVLTVAFLRDRRRFLMPFSIHSVRVYGTFFLVWFLYGVTSIIWAADAMAAIKYLLKLGAMLILCISFPFCVDTLRSYMRIVKVLYGVFTIIILYVVFESVTLIHLPSSRYFGEASMHVTSFFTNQNDLATCVTLAFPFLITALFMLPLSRKIKFLVYSTNVIALFTLFVTGSRSNTLLAFPLVSLLLLVLVPFVVRREKISKKNILRGVSLTVLAFLLAGVMSVFFLSPHARELARHKIGSTFDMFTDIQDSTWELEDGDDDEIIRGKTGESATVRKYLILNGLRFLHDSYYLGVGPGNIEPMMRDHGTMVNKVNIHNWWAEVLVNFGIPIAVLYMFLYFKILLKCLRIAQIKKSPGIPPVLRWGATASFVSLIGYFVGGIAPSTAIHFTPMWISYGLGLGVVTLAERMDLNP